MSACPPPPLGKLIVFEGARGSGKSTCLREVAEHLRSALGVRVTTTAEPTHHTEPGVVARRVLGGEVKLADPRSMQAICAADRLEHVALVIEPAVKDGQVVLCDRYVLSSAAYAPSDQTRIWDWIAATNAQAPEADLTIVLCVPMAECERRVLARGDGPDALAATTAAPELFYRENSPFAVDYAHSRRVVFVDGTASPGNVAAVALTEVLATLAEGT